MFSPKNFPSSPEKNSELTDANLEGFLYLPKYANIERLYINSSTITQLPNLDRFKELRKIIITDCPNLIGMVDLSMLTKLEKLEIRNSGIHEFAGLGRNLERIVVNNCKNLKTFPNITYCS